MFPSLTVVLLYCLIPLSLTTQEHTYKILDILVDFKEDCDILDINLADHNQIKEDDNPSQNKRAKIIAKIDGENNSKLYGTIGMNI